MRSQLQTSLALLYPPRCLSCGEIVDSDFGLCAQCWRETPFINGVVCEACGTPLPGEADGERIECDACMATPRPWHSGRAALRYEGVARKLILKLKHADRTDIAKPAGMWLARAAKPLLSDQTLIIPVPLHWSRLLGRRYNQAALLAQSLARELSLPALPDALRRVRRTQSLDQRPAPERFDLLRDAIAPNPKVLDFIKGRPVLLVDDVMTSGATLSVTAEACRMAGASQIDVVVLARVAKHS